jgi:acyl-CoA thioesterase I
MEGLNRSFLFTAIALLMISSYSQAVINIRCIGNSVTMTSQYPQKLQVLLGTTNYKVYNDGVGGTSISSWGFPYIQLDGTLRPETNFIDILAAKPQIITIDLGINDCHDTYPSDLRAIFPPAYNKLIDTFLTISPQPKIFLVLPTPLYPQGMDPGWIYADDSVVCPLVADLAKQRNLPLIDVHAPLLGHPEWYPATDGCHIGWDSPGADTIASIFYRAITATPTLVAPTANLKAQASDISIARNKQAITIDIPRQFSWTLKLFALNGMEIGRYSGVEHHQKIICNRLSTQETVIARLQTSGGQQKQAMLFPARPLLLPCFAGNRPLTAPLRLR